MGGHVEKPLLQISGESMLQHVIEVLRRSSSVDRIVVATSHHTPATTIEAQTLGVQTLITPCDGFEEDMRFAIRELSLGNVLVISADLPFVTADMLDEAYRQYRDAGKPALAVMAPIELYERLGLKPGYIFETNRQKLVPVGVNIIDGSRIDEGRLEQTELIIDSGDVAFNINTPEELQAARKRPNAARGKA
jgi:adenosylcobinamide-phosphate guanylyltransferase